MKVGDLVTVNQSIEEYTAVKGDTTGIIISEKLDQDGWMGKPHTRLFEIMWPDSEIESLYENEVEIVKTKKSNKIKN